MTRTHFTFFRSYYEAVSELPKKDQTTILLAICDYALNDKEPELSGTAKAIFSLVRPNLDASKRKADGGKRGGNAKQAASMPEASGEQSGSDKEKEKEKEREKEDGKGISSTRFRPPTADEVRAYCQEKGYSVDPARFVDYYAARGWSYGKGVPMKDWKAAVRTWVKNEPDSPSSPPSPRKYKTVLLDGEWVDVPDEEVESDA